MKNILLILITIPLIFSSCEKEENNNNNSNLSLEQTKWNVDQISFENMLVVVNIPSTQGLDGGINKIEWTFFDNNGLFTEYFVGEDYTSYDTLIYSYFSNLNTISFTDPSSDNTVMFLGHDTQSIGDGFKITLFDQNNLTVEYTDTFENLGLIIVNLSRIQ